MKLLIQFLIAGLCSLGTIGLLCFMAINEINFRDACFAKLFGLMCALAAISFFVLTQNDDNEETNPGKEKAKK